MTRRVIFVTGRTGAGKTTRARAILARERRVVVFDPVRQWGRDFGYIEVGSRRELVAAIRRRWWSGFHIAVVPVADPPRLAHDAAEAIWHVQALYETGRDPRKVAFVIEEANLAYPAQSLPRDCYGVQRAVLQGRHRGIDVVALSQRPALVSADFRGQVDEMYVFPLSADLDRARILDHIGREWEAALKSLKPHHYLRWAEGEVTTGRNPRPRRR